MAWDYNEYGLASSYDLHGLDSVFPDYERNLQASDPADADQQEEAFIEATEAQVAASLEGLRTTPFAALGLTALAERR